MCLCFNPMHWDSDLNHVATDRKNGGGEKAGLTDQRLGADFYKARGAL